RKVGALMRAVAGLPHKALILRYRVAMAAGAGRSTSPEKVDLWQLLWKWRSRRSRRLDEAESRGETALTKSRKVYSKRAGQAGCTNGSIAALFMQLPPGGTRRGRDCRLSRNSRSLSP